jgi:hypothetical protein
MPRASQSQQDRLKSGMAEQKNAGLKVVTLIATLNPVSQVLW